MAVILVEAVGVEPTSEGAAEEENYARSRFRTCSRRTVRIDKTRPDAISLPREKLSTIRAGARAADQPARMTPQPDLQANPVERREPN